VPAPRPGELRIAVGKKPYAEVIGHAVVEPDVEVCGVLVGKLEEDAHGPWVNVIAAIRGESAREEGAAVTFTHETWNHIHGELDRRYPDLQIVGWYHTHGGFGVFLSDMDRFVHENFFPEKHHVAYVYDPLAGSEAFFHRTEKGLEPVRRFWVGGRERAPATQAAPQPAAPAAAPADAGAAAPLDRAARALEAAAEQRSSLGAMLPWAIALGALALLLVEARGGGLLGGEGSARRGGGGAVALIEWDPATGRAIGIPLEVLEPVEGNVFRDAGGALRPGVQLRAADGSLLVQPGLLARLVRPPPTPAELAAERARAEAAASERAALHRLLAWIGGGVALLAAALGAGFWFLRR
jgi:proteasome lid subunit RPN8/RPN11